MDGVRVISSVAVFLFVLLASFSAAREERSPRGADWSKVTDHKYNYLAVLKVGVDAKCAGSIPSKWTVLTFCKEATADGNTKAYAGMLAVENAMPGVVGVQERNVAKVAADDTLKDLKICTLNKMWDLDAKVGSIAVSGDLRASCTSLGFGKVGSDDGVAREITVAFTTTKADCGLKEGDGFLGYLVATDKVEHKLTKLDFGGPVVCGSVLHAINKEYKEGASSNKNCNLYIEIAKHRDWIEAAEEAAVAAAAADGTGGTGGTGGNGTASSGYSIHSHLNKYSNWKVLWFLVPPIVTFLQY